MTNATNDHEHGHLSSVPPPGTPSTDEHPHTNFSREDDRWDLKNQARDWLVLLVMAVVYLGWAGIVYFFEPGIR